MRPRIDFGAPQIPLDARYKPEISWWYVPIMVKPAVVSRFKEIREAIVKLVPLSGGTGIALRWYSRDNREQGVSERIIQPGRIYIVPVVLRDQSNQDGCAYITNENWLLNKKDKKKWRLNPGESTVKPNTTDYYIQVESGKRVWKSKLPYRISVPAVNVGNGHFTMEIFYGSLY